MKHVTIILSLLLGAIFLFLECVILLFAINNRHYAYYYAWFALGSAIFLLISRYMREKAKADTSRTTYAVHMTIQVITILVLVAGLAVLWINYYLNEM